MEFFIRNAAVAIFSLNMKSAIDVLKNGTTFFNAKVIKRIFFFLLICIQNEESTSKVLYKGFSADITLSIYFRVTV